MYCKKLHATFHSKWCIYYQEKANELIKSKTYLGKLTRCLNNCRQGQQILEDYPEPSLDIDVKRLMFEYNKPIKLKLIKTGKTIPKLKLIKSNRIKKLKLEKRIDFINSNVKENIL